MVAAQAENISDAEGRCPEHIRLEGYPIAVSCHHLQHGIQALLSEDSTGRKAAEPYDTRLIVGNVDAVYVSFEEVTLFSDDARISAFRRATLGGDGKMTSLEYFP